MRHLPNIEITLIEHSKQAYDTAGDYGKDYAGWWMNVSRMKDWRYEALVSVHELVEMILTTNDKVKWKDIDYFDKKGEGKGHDDPGTLKSAPYFKQHRFATRIEKLLCSELGVDWKEYDESFSKLK